MRTALLYLAVNHFRYFLEGRHFYIMTNHKPLTFVLSTHSDKYPPRQVCHLELISQFTSNIWHVQGASNPAADALSRIVLNALLTEDPIPVIDFKTMAAAQETDPTLACLMSDSSLQLEHLPLAFSDGAFIVCDMLTGMPRSYVLDSFPWPIFDCLHSISPRGPGYPAYGD